MSPCLSICTLDEAAVCMGCLRTLDEIRNWAKLSGTEQWALVAELKLRFGPLFKQSGGLFWDNLIQAAVSRLNDTKTTP